VTGKTGRLSAGELLARTIVAALYVVLLRNLLDDYMQTGRITGLLLLASESLVLVFTIARRPAQVVDHSPISVIVTAISAVGPLLVRTSPGSGLLPDLVTTVASGIGLSIIISAKLALGRSFGIVPANRGVVMAGLYNVVRHPIYAGYLITHVSFAIAHPLAWNAVILGITDVALLVRALREEEVLKADRTYEDYCRRVAWHVLPGVF
jgi:protein-S-isoprenylcysteine O-methyltransferase Ste14